MKRTLQTLMLVYSIAFAHLVMAAAKVSWNRITYIGRTSLEEISAATRHYVKRFYKMSDLAVTARGTNEETLKLLAQRYPSLAKLDIADSPLLKDLSCLTSFTNLTSLSIAAMDIADLSSLRDIGTLERLDFRQSKLTDLTPVAALRKLKWIGFKDAALQDFTPLGRLPALEEIEFAGAQVPKSSWATLGALQQVKRFHGGRTDMRSLAWVKGASQLEELTLFAECIADWSPLAEARKLKRLEAVAMRSMVDVSYVKRSRTLEILILTSSPVQRLSELKGCTALRELNVRGVIPSQDPAILHRLADNGVKVVR